MDFLENIEKDPISSGPVNADSCEPGVKFIPALSVLFLILTLIGVPPWKSV